MNIEKWMAMNTVTCPVGRVSEKTCRALNKRKSLSDYLSKKGRVAGWGWKVRIRRDEDLRPPECQGCPGWKALFRKQRHKRRRAA